MGRFRTENPVVLIFRMRPDEGQLPQKQKAPTIVGACEEYSVQRGDLFALFPFAGGETILHLLHNFFCVFRSCCNASQNLISHGNGRCQRAVFSIVRFIGKVLREHDSFPTDTHSPPQKGSFLEGVSCEILHICIHDC